MNVGKSTVRVERENLGLTHSADLLENDIITFCMYSNDFFFTQDTVSTTQRDYTNVKLNCITSLLL
jgi:hypothetical protein